MSKDLAFLDAAEGSPEADRARLRQRAELLRLLYVGFTRPRDLLVAVAKVDPKVDHKSFPGSEGERDRRLPIRGEMAEVSLPLG